MFIYFQALVVALLCSLDENKANKSFIQVKDFSNEFIIILYFPDIEADGGSMHSVVL